MRYKIKEDEDGFYVYPVEKEVEASDYFYAVEEYWLGESDFNPEIPDWMIKLSDLSKLTFEQPLN